MDDQNTSIDNSLTSVPEEEMENQETVDTAMQVDFLVKSLIAEQGTLTEQLKEQRAMLKDALQSSGEYQDVEEKIRDLSKQKKQIRQKLMSTEAVRQAQEEVTSIQESIKTIDKKLSSYLQQYLETYHSRTIEDQDGKLREIVTLYKLVKK
ncbi:MAG: hypothetical protein ACD_48C00246G0001 [uncultured bacterium]|uniref:Uncharacterized protein n=1 Tax=Candidatus Roizmanbacteria bacterium RIFCSPLOWO2_01_FULL_45_11 TaxID=1802070 RepID=A0A1F7JCB4_9BACT|nr:MAG: hypothetical protein ACD_48C00246G0001 [uncultured bacterium]OGK53243.1 MAG: hypothetical protein A3B56_02385 [Candidatus Roizmanbacteria bacterium RIFCSPLOWO2_01_FULL_45_11]